MKQDLTPSHALEPSTGLSSVSFHFVVWKPTKLIS